MFTWILTRTDPNTQDVARTEKSVGKIKTNKQKKRKQAAKLVILSFQNLSNLFGISFIK